MTDPLYGVTLTTFHDGEADIDPLGSLLSGPRVVAESVARRYMTPVGFIPNYGYDLRSRLGARISNVGLARIREAMVTEAMKEEMVKSAAVQFESTSASYWRVRVVLELITGQTFTAVLGIDQVSARILETIDGRP